jgi:hypothetical protein
MGDDREPEPFEAPPGGWDQRDWEELQEWQVQRDTASMRNLGEAPPPPRDGGPLSHAQLVQAIRDAMEMIDRGEPRVARDGLENLLLALGGRGGVRPPLYGRVPAGRGR